MKKALIIIAIIFGLIIVAAITVPLIFRDEIRLVIDDALDESLNAKVFYDVDQFSLSLIKNFPNLTVSMGDFGIAGVDEFEEDTLAVIGSFQIMIDLMSVIGGDQIKVNEILLDRPKIDVLILPNGKANYDISKESGVAEVEESGSSEEGGDISIRIEKWEIRDGEVTCLDQSLRFYITLFGLNHKGSGDFTLDIFDLQTETIVEDLSLGFEGVDYLKNRALKADVALNMNLSEMKFTFKENRIALNDFAMGADGHISMPADDIEMDITFGGKDIDMRSILSLIPGAHQEYLDGITATGQIGFNGYVRGLFNDSSMPHIAANLSVENGSVLYADYAIPMEKIQIRFGFDYPSVDLRETSFNVDKFSMLVDGEEFSANLKFNNLEDYNWELGVDGNVDLEKILKIIPLEGIEMKGKLAAGLKTAGTMSDLEAKKYDKLPTSGRLGIRDFFFKSEDLPQGFGISEANLSFNPSEIVLTKFRGNAGKSDVNLSGKIANYLPFALGKNENLVGNLEFSSSLLDLNEWMTEEGVPAETESSEDTLTLEVVKIPENVDFTLHSSVNKVTYTNLSIDDFKGKVLVKDGFVILKYSSFSMLDGIFELTGAYKTAGRENPEYDFDFSIKELSIAEAFKSFSTVKELVPIAERITGKFSTNFTINGALGQDMMPLLDQTTASGLVNIAEATLQNLSVLDKIADLTNLKSFSSTEKGISLKNVLIKVQIKKGRLFVEPFDLSVKAQKATLSGSNGLDGSLDYSMMLKDVPTGAIGNAINSTLSSLTGGKKLISDKVDLILGVGGTYDDPVVTLLGTKLSSGGSESGGIAASIKDQVKQKITDEKKRVEEEAKAELEAQKAKLEQKKEAARQKLEEAKKNATEKAKKKLEEQKKKLEEQKKKAAEQAKNALKGIFKKKKGGGG